MTVTRLYHGLRLDIVPAASARICYVPMMEGTRDEAVAWAEMAAERSGCTLAVLSGMDWNDDLTPWPASGVFRKAKPFGGHAGRFLERLEGDFIPDIECALGLQAPERCLMGVSLAGLFAVWAGCRSRLFSSVASISGSLWYDGFVEWLGGAPVSPTLRQVFLSLGDREKHTKEPRMVRVEDATGTVAAILQRRGVRTAFTLEPGTHFSPLIPRLDAALIALSP